MNRIIASCAWSVVLLLAARTVSGQDLFPEQAGSREILQSHIEGNVPAKSDFDPFLRRDLTAYFTRPGESPVAVEYELLRNEPTQVGTAFPKYYAWVSVSRSGRPVTQGAARLAAVQRERFEITHFISVNEIRDHPSDLGSVFPESLVARIEEKARNAK